jgi:transposase
LILLGSIFRNGFCRDYKVFFQLSFLPPAPKLASVFFRRKKSSSGQCLQLLESYRNVQGEPRHRVVVSLGDASLPAAHWRAVATAVANKLYGQSELLPLALAAQERRQVEAIVKRVDREGRWQPVGRSGLPPRANAAAQTIDGVLVEQVSHTHTTPLGPSLVGWEAWQRLGLPELLAGLGFNPAQAQAAAISVIHRLASPGSERALLEWLPNSSLPELLGCAVNEGIKDRFYRVSDQLLACRAALEKHLRQKQGALFNLDRTILLYDLTNSYFEGEALGNPKAKRGHSKEKRDDCPQIVVGMIFDRYGFELAHRVFAGNQNDGKSLVGMVAELQQIIGPEERPQGAAKPLIILDGGVGTQKNLALLRQHGWGYLVNDSRRGRAAYREEFIREEEFVAIERHAGQSAVKVRVLADPESAATPPDRLVLCKSQGRRDKETAIRSQAENRFLAALEQLGKRVKSGRLTDAAKIERAIGRVQTRHARVQRFYTVGLNLAPALAVKWSRVDQTYENDDQLLGCYVLRTERQDLGGPELWSLYLGLTKAEDGFRTLKSSLGLRPNYHQLEGRVEGHVFITVLAYHLLRWVMETLEDARENRSWETLRTILQTHCYTTILLPTKGGQTYRVRKAGQPEESQKAIYRALGIRWERLPQAKVVVPTKSTLDFVVPKQIGC